MSNDIDILQQINDIDLSTVQTGFPLLKSGVVPLTIQSFEDDVEKKALKVKLVTAAPWEDIDGKVIHPGFPITDFIRFNTWTDADGKEKNFGVERVVNLRAAVFGKAKPGDKFDRTALLGQQVQARLKYDPAPRNKKTQEVYGPQTTIEAYLIKK